MWNFVRQAWKGSYQVYKIYRTVTVGKKNPNPRTQRKQTKGAIRGKMRFSDAKQGLPFQGKGAATKNSFFFLLLLVFPWNWNLGFSWLDWRNPNPLEPLSFQSQPQPLKEREKEKKSWDHCWYSGLSERRFEELQRKTCHSLLNSLCGWVFVMILPHKVRGSKDC